MGTYKVKSNIDAGNGVTYKRGDTIELSEEQAFEIRHALKNPPAAPKLVVERELEDEDEDEIEVDATSKEPMARAPRRPDDLNRVDAAGNKPKAGEPDKNPSGQTPTSDAVDKASGAQHPSGVGSQKK